MPANKTVTFDTTAKRDSALVRAAVNNGWHVAFATVSLRESPGTNFDVRLESHEVVPEIGVFDESGWDTTRWADETSGALLKNILAIISNGGFPSQQNNLTERQRHQLRDAMILEAHSTAKRIAFVSNDARAFINHGKRDRLQMLCGTRILSHEEFRIELS